MTTVRALHLRDGGALEWATLDLAPPGPREIAIEIHASGLNRADLLQRRGQYPAPPGAPATVPGLEYAGVVVARGEGAQRHAIGARVMGIVAGGGLAKGVVVHEDEALAVPEHLSFAEAAAVPEAFLTAHDALFTRAGLRAGEHVLVHAVASGVGSAGAQLALRAGARVTGTTRSPDKLEALAEKLGPLDLGGSVRGVVPDGAGHFAASVGPVDVLLDLVGASYFAEDLAVMAVSGRWILVGTLGGAKVELPLGAMLTKRLTLQGTVLRPRSRPEKIAVAQAFSERFGAELGAGRLAPILYGTHPVAEIEAAWASMSENQTVGKVVVTW